MSEKRLLIALPTPSSDRLDTVLEMFLLHQEASHHTPKTLTHYRYTLHNFLAFLHGLNVRTPEVVKPEHIRKFLVDLQQQGKKDTTLHAHARAIKTFFNFLVNEKVLDASPMRGVSMPKLEDKILPPFSHDDVDAILDACKGPFALRNRAIILCLLDSGLRAAEFVSMNVGDVDKDGLTRVRGKGQKDRYVRLGAQARKALLRYLSERKDAERGQPLWQGREGRLTVSGLQQVLRRLGRRADVVPCSPHRFRRTFAIWALREGMNVHHLRAILGHADLQMAQRYLDLVKDDIVEAHTKASPVDNFLGKKKKGGKHT